MSIDWKAQAIAISKRRGGSIPNPDLPADNQETGTRHYLHAFFAYQLCFQLFNAVIQHWNTPGYFIYIVILHGPVLLFNVWVAQGFQAVMAKRYFHLVEPKFDSVLSPMGGLTMHSTITIAQDVKVSMMLPMAYALLTFFWLAWYALLDGAAFDETITNGVTFSELDNVWGILANVSAQAIYLNVFLVALHLVVPVFPLSGASLFAASLAGQGFGLQRTALVMDCFGCLVSLVLVVIGVIQSFFDDTNGIGIFVLFNALVLITLCFKRRCMDSLDSHDLACRQCYVEKESHDNNTPEKQENTESSDNAEWQTDQDEKELTELEIV